MIEIKAPDDYSDVPKEYTKIFLAGTIDMGDSEDWQKQISEALEDITDLVILNPRRDDWDSSWKQSIEDKQFSEQVNWELSAQEDADLIAMYIAPDSESPITLLELGLFAKEGKIILCCPDGFYRKGNVDIVADRYDIFSQVDSLEELIDTIKEAVTE